MMVLRRSLTCSKGAAAAEMALILPLAVLMMFTSIEAGHYFYQEHQVIKGLRDGARFAARQSFDDINCRGGTASTVPSGIETAVKNLSRTGTLSGGTARVSGWDNADITVSVSCPSVAQATTGIYDATEQAPQVNVTTSLSYDSLFNGLGVITDSYTLNAEQNATVMGI